MSNADSRGAVEWLLNQHVILDITGCSTCPHATNGEDVNSYDPDEGYYDCTLTGQRVWGEAPVCSWDDWKPLVMRQSGRQEGEA